MKRTPNQLIVIILLILPFCFIINCQNQEEKTATPESVAKIKNLARRLFEETDKGNYEFWDEIIAPEYAFYPPDRAQPLSLEEHKQANQMMRKAFPDAKHIIDDIIAESEKVVIRLTLIGTHKGEFMGIPPTGKQIKFSAINILRFSEGKVVECWGQADFTGLMVQLGMELQPKMDQNE